MRYKYVILFLIIFAVAAVARIWKIEDIPPGLNVDEVSEGYNAYSLLKTGRDRYGMVAPITFKSYGSYQPPVYTYLTTIPMYFLGQTTLTVKFISILSGLVVIIFSFLIIKEFSEKKKEVPGLMVALVLAISPWAIFFSRIATEASVSLAIFVVGFYLCLRSVRNIKLFPLASLFFGIATHAYYSERIVSLLFLLAFVYIYRKQFLKDKKWLAVGLAIFAVTQLPHLAILQSGAFTRRLEQVSYLSSGVYETNGIAFHRYPLGRLIFIGREFASQYLAYFSPRNLFFEPDDQGARAIPDLSVFYSWMLVPWIFGLRYLIKNRGNFLHKSLVMLLFIAPIPAAISTDPFYTLRVLVLLWVFSVIISVGSLELLGKMKSPALKWLVLSAIFGFSLLTFYIHYFALFKHERGETVNFSSMKLIEITKQQPDKKFVVDLSRDIAIGLRFAYFRQYDPVAFQRDIGAPFLTKYYSSVEYEKRYDLVNVEVRPINWEEDVYKDQMLVGDLLAISSGQVAEHSLKLEFEIKDLTNNVVLRGYSTHPKDKCAKFPIGVYCKKWQ